MKKLFLAFLLTAVIGSAAFAQRTFQGTLNYSFKFMGEGVEQMEAFMPTGYEFKVRKNDMVMEMQGGMAAMMMGRILVMGKKGKVYMIKDSEETAYLMPKSDDKEEGETPTPKIEKQDETIEIAGYTCQKYKVTVEADGETATQYMWVTEELKFPEMKGGNGMSGGMGGGMRVEGINGLPLKTMIDQNGMTVIMTATDLVEESLDKTMFKIPKGYAKEDFDPSMFGGMGM